MGNIIFNDTTLFSLWDRSVDGSKITDLKKRTELINEEMDILSATSNIQSDFIKTLGDKLDIINAKIEDVNYIVGALLLKETSVITEEELKTIYKMLASPDKENKVVAVEAIQNKLKELT